MIKILTRTKHVVELDDGTELDLYHEPAEDSVRVEYVGDKIIVGYLSHDSDCSSPFEDRDGMGTIYTSHRFSDKHREMQQALGLNSDWEPNLEDVWDKHGNVAIDRYIARVWDTHDEERLADWVKEHEDTEGADAETINKRLRHDADNSYWSSCSFEKEMKAVLEEMWKDGQLFPGNKNAVLLDCYDHGGQVWSIQGRGMQDRWDTARGAGVWVPDESCEVEIESRAPVYSTHYIEQNRIRRDGKYLLRQAEDGKILRSSDDWLELFNLAKDLAGPDPKMTDEGRVRACEEICQGVLDEYNAWLSGDCWGVVVEVFDKEGNQIEQDDCWGFIGSECAEEERGAMMKHFKDNLGGA